MEELPIAFELNVPEFRVNLSQEIDLFPESLESERAVFEETSDFALFRHEDLVVPCEFTSLLPPAAESNNLIRVCSSV